MLRARFADLYSNLPECGYRRLVTFDSPIQRLVTPVLIDVEPNQPEKVLSSNAREQPWNFRCLPRPLAYADF